MLAIEDSILIDLQPSMEWDNWIGDIKRVIDDSNYHSDEISESDVEKVQDEKDNMIRPTHKEDSNHVLHVYDKPWRSSRVSININIFNIINTSIDYLHLKFLF